MPASAHHDGDRACPDAGAQVIDFAARSAQRSRRPAAVQAPAPAVHAAPTVPAQGPFAQEVDLQRDQQTARQVVAFVEKEMAARGVSLGDPSVATATLVWADVVEQILLGAWRLRYGDAERGIAANPERGLDVAGVQEMRSMVRDMRLTPSDFAALRPAAQEL